MFGWIKRLGRKPQTETQMAWDYEVPTPEQRRAERVAHLNYAIATAKRQKKSTATSRRSWRGWRRTPPNDPRSHRAAGSCVPDV